LKKYIFSILVRGFFAFSGFVFFLFTANYFGPEGRGIISYATSIFSSLGLIFSFNLGRTFLIETFQNTEHKKTQLPAYITLNFFFGFLTLLCSFIFWSTINSAQQIVSSHTFYAFCISAFFYVWNINGNAFFAAFLKTYVQEMIIFAIRFLVVLFIVIYSLIAEKHINEFIFIYSTIIAMGVFLEMAYLILYCGERKLDFNFTHFLRAFKKSLIPHLDYLSFNSFPLFVVIISGWFIEKAEIGKVGFAFQIINLIYLLSVTANIRVSAYVSDVGIAQRVTQFKKLFTATLVLSTAVGLFIYYILIHFAASSFLKPFAGVSDLFLITLLSIPGYLTYQLFNPIWLEKGMIKFSAYLNLALLILSLSVSPWFMMTWGAYGVSWIFALFHFGLLVNQIIIFYRFKKVSSSI